MVVCGAVGSAAFVADATRAGRAAPPQQHAALIPMAGARLIPSAGLGHIEHDHAAEFPRSGARVIRRGPGCAVVVRHLWRACGHCAVG